MSPLARVLRVVLNTLNGLLAGVRWLARQTYRQRTLGVSATPHLTRLLDLHAVTLAGHVALLAGLLVARPGPSGYEWLLALAPLIVLTGLGIWQSNRITIGALVAAQVAGLLIATLWVREPIILALLLVTAIAQQAALIAAWIRHTGNLAPAPPQPGTARGRYALLRATAAGLLLGIFTGGGGFVLGIFIEPFPLWICALLLLAAVVLAARMPAPRRVPVVVPQQAPAIPDGYTVYRPSSLDDKS